MGSIDLFFNETVKVKRMTDVPDTNKSTFTQVIAALACHIQPADSEISQDIEAGFGKDFTMFCETADIQEGDRVIRSIDSVDHEYRVTGIERFNFARHDHMEVTIRIFES